MRVRMSFLGRLLLFDGGGDSGTDSVATDEKNRCPHARHRSGSSPRARLRASPQ